MHFTGAKASNYAIADTIATVDTEIEAMIAPYKKQLGAEMNQVIGELEIDLIKDQPESTLGNWTADLIHKKCEDYYGKPIDFAVVNYGGLRVPNMDKGDVTKGEVFELMPFDNMLVVVHVDAKTLMELFNLMASKGGWPISHQVQYGIRGKKPQDILINGKAIDNQRMYTIALSDYIANGGDNCSFFKDKKRDELGELFRDAILQFVQEETAAGRKLNTKLTARVHHLTSTGKN